MRLLSMLLTALKNTLLQAIDLVLSVFFAPFRAAVPRGHSAVPPPPDVAKDIKAAISAVHRPPPAPNSARSHQETRALAILAMAAARVERNDLAARTHAARLPPALQTWVSSLEVPELRRVIAARTAGVVEHLTGKAIAGVPPVELIRPLRAPDEAVSDPDEVNTIRP